MIRCSGCRRPRSRIGPSVSRCTRRLNHPPVTSRMPEFIVLPWVLPWVTAIHGSPPSTIAVLSSASRADADFARWAPVETDLAIVLAVLGCTSSDNASRHTKMSIDHGCFLRVCVGCVNALGTGSKSSPTNATNLSNALSSVRNPGPFRKPCSVPSIEPVNFPLSDLYCQQSEHLRLLGIGLSTCELARAHIPAPGHVSWCCPSAGTLRHSYGPERILVCLWSARSGHGTASRPCGCRRCGHD